MDELDYRSTPFEEALEFLRKRIALPSKSWRDFSLLEANAAFFSAGAIDANLLADLKNMVDRAIAEGTPYDSAQFAQQFDNFAARYGWDYKGKRDWRARLILAQNLRTAYNAGRHDQQFNPTAVKLQPFVKYVHSGARNYRLAHLALDGKVFRKDDPIVEQIYPPNGFNCGCKMIALSQRQVDKQGLNVEQIKLGDTVRYEDNGEEKEVVIQPDAGFAGAPTLKPDTAVIDRLKQKLPPEWSEKLSEAWQ